MKTAVIGRQVEQQVEGRERLRRLKEGVDSAMRMPERVPSPFYWGLSLGSVAASIVLFATKRKEDAIFVGLWAPTFLALGAFAKLVGKTQERASEPEV